MGDGVETTKESEIAQLLSEPLLSVGHISGIVLAYVTDNDQVLYNFYGGRVQCRGLAEELCDYLSLTAKEADEMETTE